MLIILETSRKEELHNWHAADRRYPLLMVAALASLPVDPEIQQYGERVAELVRITRRRVTQERVDRNADNT